MSSLKLNNMNFTRLDLSEKKQFGNNLLQGLRPKITSLGEVPEHHDIAGKSNDEMLDLLSDDNHIAKHVDFCNFPFTFTYDLGKKTTIDNIHIGGFVDYFLIDFELYASNCEEELFLEENLVVTFISEKPNDLLKACDWTFSVSGSCRYFGVKVNAGCHKDERARISRIALFSDENNVRYSLKRILNIVNDIEDIAPVINGKFLGESAFLGNGTTMLGETVKAETDLEITYTYADINCDKLYLFGKNITVTKLVADGKEIEFSSKAENSFNGNSLYVLNFKNIKANTFSVFINSGAEIDQIFTDSEVRFLSVDTSNVIMKDFIGAGCNVFPTFYSEYGKRVGANEVFWQMEKERIKKSKIHAVRMWFQIDWMVDTREQYENGNWQWNNDEMQSVVRTCKAFREAGTEIELNFGWKVGRKVWDWFCVKGLEGNQNRGSAPADLYNYGKALTACLEYLILEHGCDNIKYVSFYNEPSIRTHHINYDFAICGDNMAYWASMLRYAHYFVNKSKVAGMVEFWACEQCVDFVDAMKRIEILAGDCFTTHTIHRYLMNYDDICEWYDNDIIPSANSKPIILSEFGNCSRKNIGWHTNHINNILAGANHGVNGAFLWVMSGQPLVDPCNWIHAHNSLGGIDYEYSHWNYLPNAESLNDVGESFYELSLLYHYIPKHANVLKATLENNYTDTRVNAFYKDGEYTFCVESQGLKETEIKIKLDKAINKTLYKYVYKRHEKGEGNLTVPTCCSTFTISDTLCDKMDTDYSFVVYSTIKPIRQVLMDNVDIRVPVGTKEVEINAKVVDCDYNAEVKYEITESLMDGAILQDKTLIIPDGAKTGDMLAIKASIETGESGLTIVRLV